jgi:hypothetical protein
LIPSQQTEQGVLSSESGGVSETMRVRRRALRGDQDEFRGQTTKQTKMCIQNKTKLDPDSSQLLLFPKFLFDVRNHP